MGDWLGFVPFLKGRGGRIIHSHQNVTEWVFLQGKDPASGTQRAGTSARPHPWALQKPRQMTAEEAHGADAPFQTTPAQADFGDPGRFSAPSPSPGCAHFTDGQLRPLVPSPASLEHWEMRVASTPNPLPFRRAASGAVLPAGCPSSPPSSWRARRLRCPPRPKPAPFSPSLQVGGCFIYEVLGGVIGDFRFASGGIYWALLPFYEAASQPCIRGILKRLRLRYLFRWKTPPRLGKPIPTVFLLPRLPVAVPPLPPRCSFLLSTASKAAVREINGGAFTRMLCLVLLREAKCRRDAKKCNVREMEC